MATDKNPTDKTGQPDQQAVQNQKTPINPFRDPAPPEEDPQQRRNEEIELEQQRKEALTERD